MNAVNMELNKCKTAYWRIHYIRCQAQYGKIMIPKEKAQELLEKFAVGGWRKEHSISCEYGDMVWFYDPYVEKLRYSNISEIQHDDGTF